ncbi:hypothetical protein SAMN04488554_3240 [Ruania alba]|uniref:Uncharacterized protein n=1 Tax=Ruania alba TaxID=648782 RepID=A0A1H5M9Z7_9MICO|nr:hypothetical protein SAMN04488554_3240 [Ruania alba]
MNDGLEPDTTEWWEERPGRGPCQDCGDVHGSAPWDCDAAGAALVLGRPRGCSFADGPEGDQPSATTATP